MKEWQPIGTAPRNTLVLVVVGQEIAIGHYGVAFSDYPERWYFGGEHWPAYEPTHWQPLPAPPAAPEAGR